ncbi:MULTISPECIES: phage major capsid protein [unclassified Gilliamella]|uniref:phage major capsid protein n=1 Tax=unclassified Gilliamella TaxID=2685620 RepID=UPI00080DDB9A|nr:phage major capsid protein [Gilliamella apicola]OCG34783.1 capsid protein [Gilliamella apicola]OCG47687.1 capsid protein [Gilliamella apicola]OCG50634.1 capsid protein [Gilliamella apicola]
MAVDQKDVELVAQEIKNQFEQFKATNDKRLDAIEQEKAALAGKVESQNAKLSELDNIKTALENELKEVKRPIGGNKQATAHKEAFAMFIRKGDEQGLAELERKAMQTGVDADGGFAVPEELNTDILAALRDEVVMRQECTVMTVGTPDWKKLTNKGSIASGWVGETDERTETGTPKLGVISPVWGEIYGNPYATQTMLDDAFFNVESFIVNELSQEFAEKEEEAFTLGDGNKKPKGFLAYETTAQADKDRDWGKLQNVVAGAANLTTDDIVKLTYTLRKVYRAGAKFMMNNQSLLAVRLLKDSNGNYIWQPGLQVGQPSLLSGFAVAENEQMPDIGDSSGKAPIAFGNFKRGFYIFDRIGIRMLRDPYTKKPFVGFYTTKRVGSMLNDSNAIKVLTMPAVQSRSAKS